MDLFANLNLLAVFLIIGGIGFVFLLASLVLGDIFDMFGGDAGPASADVDFGFLDSRVIAVFITAFGGFGAIAVQIAVAIKPGEVGQISVRIGDERVEKIARSSGDEEIKAGTLVRIAAIAGDSVIVEIERGEK